MTKNTLTRVIQVEKVLGTSKVGPKYRITLVKPVQTKLKVKIGDLVVFVQDEKGNILLKVSKLT
jgi:bifunctional DNA-binding transcriptional regulator/antitoxin component of YhaV-PrlF toxin-antitoxin module